MVSITLFAASSQSNENEQSNDCPAVHEKPIAVFIQPSDKKIELMKKEDGDGFYTIADDAMYYQAQAIEYLKKKRFPYCFTENEKHEFISEKKKRFVMDKKCEGWCLILWNGKDEPVRTYTVDIAMHEAYLKKAKLK
jgi:hypothetical protein